MRSRARELLRRDGTDPCVGTGDDADFSVKRVRHDWKDCPKAGSEQVGGALVIAQDVSHSLEMNNIHFLVLVSFLSLSFLGCGDDDVVLDAAVDTAPSEDSAVDTSPSLTCASIPEDYEWTRETVDELIATLEGQSCSDACETGPAQIACEVSFSSFALSCSCESNVLTNCQNIIAAAEGAMEACSADAGAGDAGQSDAGVDAGSE